MKYFVIFLILASSFFTISTAYGIWLPQSPEELLEESQVIFVGTITSVDKLELEQPAHNEDFPLILDEYTVSVEESVKYTQIPEIITVRQPTVSTPGRLLPFGGFEVGDRVLFYIESFDGINTYSKESFLIPKECDTRSVIIKPRMIGDDYTMMQNGIEKQDTFTANFPIQFTAKRDMGTLSGASLEYDVYISKQVGKTYKDVVLNQTVTGDAQPCEWLSIAEWEFTPDAGNYLLNGRVYKVTSSFSISNQFFSVLADSPLKQFKSGVPIDEIQCNEPLILVTKNNNTPACVKEQTLLKLVERELIITSKTERDLMLDAGYKLYPGVGWVQGGQENPISSEPEPPPISIDHQNLIDARNKLREVYHANASLGPFNIKDVIVGYGTGDGFLVVDILEKYYDSDEDRKLIIQKIIDIAGEKVDIEFNSSVAIIPTSIESVFPYIWNGFLHRNGIEFTPKEQSYSNIDIGFRDVNRVCSPIITSNGTELYISSVFVYEPFEIMGTYIDKTKSDDCYKIWKTDTILVEPTRELGMWLENYWEKENEN